MSFQSYFNKIYSLKFLLESQWWDKNQLEELQLEGLKELVAWAKLKSPFYKDAPVINSIEDLKQAPILTKSIMNKNFNKILIPEIPYCITTTGGTISRVTVAGDLRGRFGWEEKRYMLWYPVKEIKRPAFLWGSLEVGQDIHISNGGLWLPVERLINKSEALRFLDAIGKFSPDYFKCYAVPLYVLAQYARELGKEELIHNKIGVIASHCETLTSQMKKVVEEVFGCEVYNFYGSRDLGSQAQDCEKHRNLHCCMERYIIEIVDGKFLFTDLLNYASPMIRYENQDIGEWGEDCTCGRGLITIKPLIGRVLSYLQSKKDEWISAFIIANPVKFYDMNNGTNYFKWVEAFQIKQREQGELTILLKPWSDAEVPTDLRNIMKVIRMYVKPEDFDVEIEIVDKIPLSPSGKQLAVDTTLTRWEI